MILLDTHIWVRWLISGDLKAEIVVLIENAAEVAVSSISCWEVAHLAKRGRIKLPVSPQQWNTHSNHNNRPIITTRSFPPPAFDG